MALSRESFRCLDPMRVRWAEVDIQKIVFNGHYLTYFDTAVASYWRAMALPYHDTMASFGGDLFVRKATVEYEASARYDDALHVGVRLSRLGRSSMNLQCAVFRRDKALVHGELIYVYANPATQTSEPIPAALREVLEAFEAGQSMVQPGATAGAGGAMPVMALRRSLDAEDTALLTASMHAFSDDNSHHVWLQNRLGMCIAAARLRETESPTVFQLDGLVVTPNLRHSEVLDNLLNAARSSAGQRGALHMHTLAPQGLVRRLVAAGWSLSGSGTDGLVPLNLSCGV